ncbi:MAG: hypothetical protein PVH41_12000 [Anaerolineae bacterium]|jgi:hypothetical protein
MAARTTVASAVLVVLLVVLLIAGAATTHSAQGTTPESGEVRVAGVTAPLLHYQGRLTDPGTGDSVSDGLYTMTFRLYDLGSGGLPLWMESKDVTVQGGVFSTALGDTAALNPALFNGQALWLGVKVGADAEATPRQMILPVAYALSLVPGAQISTTSSSATFSVSNAGSGDALQIDGATTLNGDLSVSGSLSGGSHAHSGDDITAGTVAEARVDASIARDSEIVPTVLNNDGAGSGLDADTVDGLHASGLATHYQNVVVVAKSGGDYTSVQGAIDSITDAAADNPYLVWVAPGVYSETVKMEAYVHLQGAGQGATVITSTIIADGTWPPTAATLVLASDVTLRDLTVANGGAGTDNVALLATAGTTRTLVADVTAWALGGGVGNYAVVLSGSGTDITLQQVTALADNSSAHGIGLINTTGAATALRGGDFTGRGEGYGWGIFTRGVSTTLEAEGISALGEDGSDFNVGLYNYDLASAVVRGGDFTGRGGNQATGISNAFTSTMTAESITALAENGADNYSLGNYNGATLKVAGAAVTARGGGNNYALSNEFNVTMEADRVTALAKNGSGSNYGMWNVNNAQATVRFGSFTGRGGTNAWGITCHGSGTTLEAQSVTALGENGSDQNFGLQNGAVATLRGGSFTGRGGYQAWGIFTCGSGTTLEAESVTALGEGSSNITMGLENYDGAQATLRGGSFAARGAIDAIGIANHASSSTLAAERVSALGEDGSSSNYGLSSTGAAANVAQSVLEGETNSVYHDDSGQVTVTNSRLVDGAVSGTVTCVAVSRDNTFNANGCP